MTDTNGQAVRWDRDEAVRARLKSGFYDDPEIQNHLIVRSLDALQADLLELPAGNGDQYRDLVAQALGTCLKDVIDVPLIRKEVTIEGGRADLELPIRIENIDLHPVWRSWHQRFDVRCMLVETKNMQTSAAHEDVNQLRAYLDGANRGRLGLIASRNGFTRNAFVTLSSIARSGSHLLLPFDNRELVHLLRLSEMPKKAMEFLRRKELFLLQAA